MKVLKADELSPISNINEIFQKRLANPFGMNRSFTTFFREHYQEGATIMILMDDHTRPNIHTKLILPKLMNKLKDLGAKKRDIKILISTGTHRPSTQEEVRNEILGEKLYDEYQDHVLIHDCDKNNSNIGETDAGTPILVDERLLESSIVIPLTDSEFHYFAGVAGTIKEFIPGNAGRKTVQWNHVKMFNPQKGFKEGVRPGATKNNPVIKEIKQMVKKISKRVSIFCIDCIMEKGEPVQLSAGDIFTCHEKAKQVLSKLSEVKVDELADLVIVSAGSLGINLYQAGKAFHAGWHAVKKNKKSWIIVLASCKDDWGKEPYYEAMKEVKGMNEGKAIKHLLATRCTKKNFEIGDQKSVDTLRILKTVGEGNLKIVSEMDPDILKRTFRLDSIKDQGETPREALKKAIKQFTRKNKDPHIYLIRNPGILTSLNR